MAHRKSTTPTPPQVKRFTQIATELKAGKSFPITRLTSIKSLSEEEKLALKFCCYLASLASAALSKKRPSHMAAADCERYCELLAASVAAVQRHQKRRSKTSEASLGELLRTVRDAQSSYRNTKWALVRTIDSTELLQGELALKCAVNPWNCSRIAYQAARNYAERYSPKYGTGLIPTSAPRLREIIRFWDTEAE